ncbi:MAG: T9SS type A sorting domain-containing protein [Dyadobacter fermentans]
MKTRRMWFSLVVLTVLLMPQLVRAQNAGINIDAPQTSILNGQQGVLDVYVCNNDVNGLDTPTDAITPLISFPLNLTVVSVKNTDGTDLLPTDFDNIFIDNTDTEGSHNVKVRIKKPLIAFGACAVYRITVQGNAVGTGDILGTLLFEKLLQSNSPLDDNSEATIPVLINLPVTLKDFNATKVEQSAVLKWSTAEETNSDYFDVQRSANGREWATIQTIQSVGESKTLRTYEAIDLEPMNGENLYRLKMVDNDLSTAYSSVKSLEFDTGVDLVYPNPVVDFLHLDNKNWAKVSAVTIHDLKGRAVYESGTKPEAAIDMRSFTNGVYVVRIKSSDGSEGIYRIVIAK